MSSKLNILFLSSWFPSKYIPTIGNFVKAHAKAIASYHNVDVIYVTKVHDLDFIFVSENIKEDNLNICLMYFREAKTGVPFLNRLVNTSRHFRAYKKLFHQLENTPDLVHANVVWPIGLFALWLKMKYKLKFILTEHWSVLKEKEKFNFLKQNLILMIFRNASMVLPVSECLQKVIKQWDDNLPFRVISNLVNIDLFNYQDKEKTEIYKWAHVSTLDAVKNGKGIVRVFSNLLKTDIKNHLSIISDGDLDPIKQLIEEFAIPTDNIKLMGTSTNEGVAELLKASDAYLQFSKNETFGIVVAEALCCGLPVVSTKVGLLKEFNEEQIGLFVKENDENDLLQKMKSIKKKAFDGVKCSRYFSNIYNRVSVVEQYTEVYKIVLDR